MNNETYEATVTIENELGLHARAATLFVQIASRYQAEIFVNKDGREVSGKSIMGVLTLVASKGSTLLLKGSGPDAQEAIEALRSLIADRFGEIR